MEIKFKKGAVILIVAAVVVIVVALVTGNADFATQALETFFGGQ